MPGLDRTGPRGYGAMTGWGSGCCSGPTNKVVERRFPGADSRSALYGRGICYGIRRRAGGRFFAPGRGFVPGGYGYGPRFSPEEYREEAAPETEREYEMKMLREEAEVLQKELEAVRKRIDEIKSSDKREDE